ncbi:hypothetical protein EMCRGX_G029636 [Ephydatia muelleri]|eukprot:Em0013g126a
MATPGPSATLNLQLVSEYVRSELGGLLDKTAGPKDVVIQQELMSLLSHIANVKFLRSHGVDKIYRLEQHMRVPGYHRYYIVRPEVGSTSAISNHITQDMKDGVRINYNVVFVPRKLACCDMVLERDGVFGQVMIHEWNLYLIPLDEHILSLEVPDATQALYLHGDYTLLHSVAQSVIQLECLYGTIKTFRSKGTLSKTISDLLQRLRKAYGIREESWGDHSISELIMIDRSVDLVTPLCSQMTYEGMLDDTLGIHNGFIQVTKATTGRLTDTKVLVNSTDPVFILIRGQLFSKVPRILSRLTQELKGNYDTGKGAKDIRDLKEFVTQLPELKKKHESLSTHLRVSEKIVTQKKVEDFKRQLSYERAILEGQDTGPIFEYIEECIQRQVSSLQPIRLLCLLSLTSGGIKSRYYQSMKLQYLQSYGYNNLSTFYTLEQLGLLRERTGDQITYQSSFKQFNKALKLVPKCTSPEEMERVEDMSYVFGGTYLPLGCTAIKSVIENGSWKAMEDISKMWKGPAVPPSSAAAPVSIKKREKGGKPPGQGGRTIVVYFVGGCTFSEINALQRLGEELDCKIVVATTNIISATTLLESLVKSN